jgi:hypothetical protein
MEKPNARRRRRTSENIGTVVPKKFASGNLSKFGRHVWLAADGVKPGEWLAARIRAQGGLCSDRHGNLIVQGKRRPNPRAIAAMHFELLED